MATPLWRFSRRLEEKEEGGSSLKNHKVKHSMKSYAVSCFLTSLLEYDILQLYIADKPKKRFGYRLGTLPRNVQNMLQCNLS